MSVESVFLKLRERRACEAVAYHTQTHVAGSV